MTESRRVYKTKVSNMSFIDKDINNDVEYGWKLLEIKTFLGLKGETVALIVMYKDEEKEDD